MAIVIKHHQTTIARIDLLHPVERVPAIARQVGWYTNPATGRVIGLKLAFAGGHTCCLTYEEIGELKEAAENY